MNKKDRTVSVSGALLALAFALLLAGRLSAGDDDTKAEKSINSIGGKVVRDDKATGKPVIVVDLTNTKVTDAGLKELAGLKSLQTLRLSGTAGVTDAGVAELQKALPKCKVLR